MATSPATKIPDMFVRALKRKADSTTTASVVVECEKKTKIVQDEGNDVSYATTNTSLECEKKTKIVQVEVHDENVATIKTGFCLFNLLKDKKWREILRAEFSMKYMQGVEEFLRSQYAKNVPIFPPREEIFSAFNLTSIDCIRVVIIGQDPYHGIGQAHGLCFSVKMGVPPPPSLKNIYKELSADIPGFVIPNHGFLLNWATQGVFMLNATLTVESGKANSHEKIGWQKFTDRVISLISSRTTGVVFLLWGGFAQKKASLVDLKKHAVIKTAHPSPLSATKWFGCRCFSRTNAELVRMGREPIDWYHQHEALLLFSPVYSLTHLDICLNLFQAEMGSVAAPVTGRPLMGRRQFCCNECHRKFKNKEELLLHAEACIMEAFESEVIAAFNDSPLPALRTSHVSDLAANAPSVASPGAGFGITVKRADVVQREEFVTLKVGEEQPKGDGAANENLSNCSREPSQPRPITYGSRNDDISQAQTIEGPNGLKLVVTVEKPETTDTPPTLNPEETVNSETLERETNTSELDSIWSDGDDTHFESQGTSDSNQVPGTSFNPMKRPQVIGALANANDDPYKPKMECPTCGLVLYRHNFSTHYRIHTGELPFYCEFCPKRFRTTSSLKVHVRAHTGEKPYICPLCGYSTITKRNLDRHIENHHVRLGGSRGPATRKSRYRESVETEWLEDMRPHTDPHYEQNHENVEEHDNWDQRPHMELVHETNPS